MCFSIRPFEVKRFQAALHCDVGLSLRALASLRNRHVGPSMMGSEERSGTIFRASFAPIERKEQHMHRTHFVHRPARDNPPPQRGTVNSSFWCARLLWRRSHQVGCTSLVQRKSVPLTHMRCKTTASRRAKATIAFCSPRRAATFIAHAFSQDHLVARVSIT